MSLSRTKASMILKSRVFAMVLAAAVAAPQIAHSAEIKVLTAGAFKAVVLELAPDFEKQTGHKVTVDNGTTGQVKDRIEKGEVIDIAIITPTVVDGLLKDSKLTGSRIDLATVGVGVAVKEGASKPDISSVDAFKQAVLAAKTVAYIDPASGGTSGVYLDKLFERWGIADRIRPKAKLQRGGYVAELVAKGEAELAIHQISEILPVKGVVLVGALPAEIQLTTTYSGALSANAPQRVAAETFLKVLSSPQAAAVLAAKGMQQPKP